MKRRQREPEGARPAGTDREAKPAWSTAAATIGLHLVVLSGSSSGRRVRVGNGLRIGSAEDNDLILNDRTVSRRHCELVRTALGVRIVDHGSTNGTWIAGTRVTEATIGTGVVLKVGQVELELRPKVEPLALPPSKRDHFGEAVGVSLAMRRVFAVLEYVASSDATVLLTGETGTGKDVLARAIVQASPRAAGPFVVVDCGAIARGMIESELFGHERGAYTGASSARRGAFESAAKGTLFLDEIGELPIDLQPKLLRVLEARELRRVGGSNVIPTDVRIIAATRRDLEAEVAAGRFREDLFFRLAVVPIELPPLRERREDIPLLVERLLTHFEGAGPSLTLGVAEMAELVAANWPGNVRELRNVLERAIVLARASGRSELCLPSLGKERTAAFETLDQARSRFERQWLAELIASHGGDIAEAARTAGLDEERFRELLEGAGLDATRPRGER
jgi:DNA-binding NtrC family response regulator